ncbi:MAG TPA: T9SS type A sorting domain-containing protein, partial [Flavobacteriales bacterium]|nr:T9SS type A sorting domain-containing protein [Flavobacteriales bacterium]
MHKQRSSGARCLTFISMFRLCTMLLLGLSVLPSRAQSDTIFPNVNGDWDMITTTWDWDGQNMNFLYYPHSMHYEAQPAVEEFGHSWGTVYDILGSAVGLIAVDSGRVWYRATALYNDGYAGYSDTTARVLYDFNITVGDTAYLENMELGLFVIVESIDTVQISGRERRRFMLSNSDVWIEGMGSMGGLLRPVMFIFENACDLNAFCGNYIDADNVAYTSCLGMGMEPRERKTDQWTAYPNPCTDAFILEGVRPSDAFVISDARGVAVSSGTITDTRATVDMRNAGAGIYFVRIGERVQRIVVR